MTDLLPDEVKAKSFVLRIGEVRALKLLTAVCTRIERRIEHSNQQSFSHNMDITCVRQEPWEINLIFNVKMGLSLTNTNSPEKAKARILARRKAKRLARLEA